MGKVGKRVKKENENLVTIEDVLEELLNVKKYNSKLIANLKERVKREI